MIENITKGWITTILGTALIIVGVILQFKDLQSILALVWEAIGLVLILSPDKLIDALIEKIKR